MPTLVGLAESVAVGAVTSTVIGVTRAPARFWLPAASVKVLAATEIRPEPVKLAVGVKIAVYAVPLPAKFDIKPLVAVMSPMAKVVDAAESVKVINADAFVWLDQNQEVYDFVVIDFPDPTNYSLGKLYTSRFYRLLGRHLEGDSLVVVQATSPLVARRSFWCVVTTMEAAGLSARPYHAFVTSFGEWGYVLARRGGDERAMGALPTGLRYFTAEAWGSMGVFAPDMARLPSQVNRLNNQVLVRTYEEEWHRWTR